MIELQKDSNMDKLNKTLYSFKKISFVREGRLVFFAKEVNAEGSSKKWLLDQINKRLQKSPEKTKGKKKVKQAWQKVRKELREILILNDKAKIELDVHDFELIQATNHNLIKKILSLVFGDNYITSIEATRCGIGNLLGDVDSLRDLADLETDGSDYDPEKQNFSDDWHSSKFFGDIYSYLLKDKKFRPLLTEINLREKQNIHSQKGFHRLSKTEKVLMVEQILGQSREKFFAVIAPAMGVDKNKAKEYFESIDFTEKISREERVLIQAKAVLNYGVPPTGETVDLFTGKRRSKTSRERLSGAYTNIIFSDPDFGEPLIKKLARLFESTYFTDNQDKLDRQIAKLFVEVKDKTEKHAAAQMVANQFFVSGNDLGLIAKDPEYRHLRSRTVDIYAQQLGSLQDTDEDETNVLEMNKLIYEAKQLWDIWRDPDRHNELKDLGEALYNILDQGGLDLNGYDASNLPEVLSNDFEINEINQAFQKYFDDHQALYNENKDLLKKKSKFNDQLLYKEKTIAGREIALALIKNKYDFFDDSDRLFSGVLDQDQEAGGLADQLIEAARDPNFSKEVWENLKLHFLSIRLNYLGRAGVEIAKLIGNPEEIWAEELKDVPEDGWDAKIQELCKHGKLTPKKLRRISDSEAKLIQVSKFTTLLKAHDQNPEEYLRIKIARTNAMIEDADDSLKKLGKEQKILQKKLKKDKYNATLGEQLSENKRRQLYLKKYRGQQKDEQHRLEKLTKTGITAEDSRSELIVSINEDLETSFQAVNEVTKLTNLKNLEVALREDQLDLKEIYTLMTSLGSQGLIKYVEGDEFEQKYKGYTDSFMVAHGDTIVINTQDPLSNKKANPFKFFYAQVQQMGEDKEGMDYSWPRDDPYMASFCDKLSHEIRHLRQERVLDGDTPSPDPEILIKKNRFFNDPSSKKIIAETEAYFQKIGKTPPKGKKWKSEDIWRELDSMEAENWWKKENPITNKLADILQNYHKTVVPGAALAAANKMMPTMGKPIRGSVDSGGVGDLLDSSGGGGDSSGKKEESVTQVLPAKDLINSVDVVLEGMPILRERAKLFKDREFMDSDKEIVDNLENIRENLERTASDDKDSDVIIYREETKKYLDKLTAQLDKFKDEVENFKKNSGAGYFRHLWKNSHFLSLDDVFQIGMTVKEWAERRYKRQQDLKLGTIGNDMFDLPKLKTLAQDFNSKVQSAENEEVQKYSDVMKDWGLDQVIKAIRYPKGNQDFMKASFIELSNRGTLEPEWENELVWQNLSIFSGRAVYSKDTAKKAVDNLWGKNQSADWSSQDNSNMVSKSNEAQAEGTALGSGIITQLDLWINDLREYSKDNSKLEKKPDYTKILGFGFIDLKTGINHGIDVIPRLQEIIMLGGLPDHAVMHIQADLQNDAPVFSLFSLSEARKYGLGEKTGFIRGSPPPIPATKLNEFMKGEIPLKLKWDPKLMGEVKYSETPHYVTIHDFQNRKSGGNRTATQLGEFDQEYQDYNLPSVTRSLLGDMLKPNTDGEDKINRKRQASGMVGCLKKIRAYANEKNAPLKERKEAMKEQIQNLITMIDFSKRFSSHMAGQRLITSRANDFSNTDYSSHYEPEKVDVIKRNFQSRTSNKYDGALIREKGLLGWALQTEAAVKRATGGELTDFPLSEMMNDIDENSSPFDKGYYEKLMSGIDKIK